LYDVTVGAVSAMYAFACALSPPMKWYASSESPSGSSSLRNAFSPSRHRLMWKWQPLPVRCAKGFGMNVAIMPRSCAIASTM
jgi:hypothetical protein